MSIKIVPVLLAVILLSAVSSVALAKDLVVDNESMKIKTDVRINLGSGEGRDNATSSADREDDEKETSSADRKDDENATSTEANVDGELTASLHRSVVSQFVKELNAIADREGKIGAQVRIVARAQNDSATTSEQSILKVENKGKFSAFLFGSDYTSLNKLRKVMVTTQNNIDELKRLFSLTTTDADRASLSAQIVVLENSRAQMEAFVETHDNSFSLFGWFVKLFSK